MTSVNDGAELFCDQTRLRVAAIMDAFTLSCFAPEFAIFEVDVDVSLGELAAFSPDILFVESAFFGKGGRWWSKIAGRADEFKRVMAWCKENAVPTIFWNKEDPVHFNYFIAVAADFDHVFTTNIDCIPEYKRRLSHDRVHLLPFAAQLRTHNPAEIDLRRDAICFAGSYYARFSERAKNLKEIFFNLASVKSIEIYDRHSGNNNSRYKFPPEYESFILGSLPYDEISIAYKGYIYSLNMNTVKQSSTMFSRRVFELLASNAIVISNFSYGIRLLFGDIVLCGDNGADLKKRLNSVDDCTELRSKRQLLGLRKIGLEHLYLHRASRIAKLVLGVEIDVALPRIVVVAYARTQQDCDQLIAGFRRQTHTARRMLLVCETDGFDLADIPSDVEVLCVAELGGSTLRTLLGSDEWLSAMVPQDYYGPNFLLDLLIAARLCRASLVGKVARYIVKNDNLEFVLADQAYRANGAIAARASAIDNTIFPNAPIAEWVCSLSEIIWKSGEGIAIDPFNYCEGGSISNDMKLMAQRVGDIEINQGISLETLYAAAENLSARSSSVRRGAIMKANRFLKRVVMVVRRPQVFWKGLRQSVRKLSHSMHPVYFTRASAMDLIRKLKSRPQFEPEPACLLGSGTHLVVTNSYPSYGALYANYFVHTRVQAYLDRGIVVDVFCLTDIGPASFDEFEGVNVVRGTSADLDRLLLANRYSAVMVHFLTPAMWLVISRHVSLMTIVIWAHGFEIQSYRRRITPFQSPIERFLAKRKSDLSAVFWRTFLENPPLRVKLVFVSKYLAEEVISDLAIDVAPDFYTVIHNPIDTKCFRYRPKPAEQRLRILSIRPFASAKYANDITVRVIIELSKRSIFSSLEFRIVGDGYYFDRITEPLKQFSNVVLDKRFLRREEIADLHREFGIFLCPSRSDTQGVSRDEAMASGLVPITNAVQAIPEFVDSTCGFLAPPEDVAALVEAIALLVADPERFCAMSEAAARRVRRQSDLDDIISKEIALFAPTLGSEVHH